jgi:hypothetical protein
LSNILNKSWLYIEGNKVETLILKFDSFVQSDVLWTVPHPILIRRVLLKI